MSIFKRIFPKLRRKDPYIPFGGMEPGMDEYDLARRQECIEDILAETKKTRAEAEELADSWFIMEVSKQIDGGTPVKQYVPRPVWDWDWAFRRMFDTREAALEHIGEKRARLLEDEDDGSATASPDVD